MWHVLRHRIVTGPNACDKYTCLTWLNKKIYRRTVDLGGICIQ
jgi:hypothetical protein